MIISDDLKDIILGIIENYFNALLLKLAGKDSISDEERQILIDRGIIKPNEVVGLAEDAYYIGRLRPHLNPPKTTLKDIRATKYQEILSPVETYAIKHVKESAGNYIVKLRDYTKALVSEVTANKNMDYRNAVLTETIRPILEEGIQKRKAISGIASQLRDKTKDLYRKWQLVVTTEMTSAVNLGAQDAIIKQNEGKSSKEIYVAKIVKNDGALCPVCKKFFVGSDGKPVVYRLSTLQKNGDNYGRKSKELKPTVGTIHPNCRCQLIHIQAGWDFDAVGTELIFVGEKKEGWRKNLK